MSLLTLHNDILLEILKWTTEASPSDRITLVGLRLTCHSIRAFMQAHREAIEIAFTYPVRSWQTCCYYFCGRRHRRDGPAEVQFGTEYWSRCGAWHRDGDLPAIVSGDRLRQTWYQHGLIHRGVDLPSDYSWYSWYWCDRGNQHRDVGPAIVRMIFTDYMSPMFPCVPWDGHTDVSTAEFDWRRVLAEDDLVRYSPLIAIMYVWCINGKTMRGEKRALTRTSAGAYVVGELI